MTQARPVVVGGGLAGLTCALALAERGLRPLLLETHPARLGGRWRGGTPEEEVELDGVRFPSEHGLHGLWGEYHNLRALLTRFLGERALDRLLVADRQEWFYAAGGARRAHRVELGRVVTRTRIPAPFHYLALFARPSFLGVMTPLELASLPWVFASLQLALTLDPLVRVRDAEMLSRVSVREFFLGWAPRLRAMVAALARSGLFADPDVAPLAGFVAFLRFYTLLRRDAQQFLYLPADPERVVFAPLRAALQNLGGEVRLGATARRLERAAGEHWRVAWADAAGAERLTEAGPVVLALDAPAARALLVAGEATRRVAEAHVEWPRALASAVARLWWDRPPEESPRDYAEAGIFGGDFTADNLFWLHRIQRDAPFAAWAEATGGGACEAHVYGPDEVLEQEDAAVLARVVLDVRRVYPRLREARLRLATLRRNPPTHTLFGIGSTSRHLEVEGPWPGVWFCGDWVRYPSPALFLERAAVTGLAAASGVLRAFGLPPEEIRPTRPPEPLARALGATWRLLVGR